MTLRVRNPTGRRSESWVSPDGVRGDAAAAALLRLLFDRSKDLVGPARQELTDRFQRAAGALLLAPEARTLLAENAAFLLFGMERWLMERALPPRDVTLALLALGKFPSTLFDEAWRRALRAGTFGWFEEALAVGWAQVDATRTPAQGQDRTLLDEVGDPTRAVKEGVVGPLGHWARALVESGRAAEAHEQVTRALARLAEEHRDDDALGLRFWHAHTALLLGRWDEARATAEDLLERARRAEPSASGSDRADLPERASEARSVLAAVAVHANDLDAARRERAAAAEADGERTLKAWYWKRLRAALDGR